MTTWFNGTGAFSKEELKAFIEDYQRNGHHNYRDTIDLGEGVDAGVQNMVNESGKIMGNLSDRLALTIIDLAKRKMTQHKGDCTIYATLHNGSPEAGICVCGYGLQVMRDTGSDRELYSEELRGRVDKR